MVRNRRAARQGEFASELQIGESGSGARYIDFPESFRGLRACSAIQLQDSIAGDNEGRDG
jgi:hypothetical protein